MVCVYVCVCVCVCESVCVCVTFISITQKEIVAETSNLVFYICITYRCYLKLFIKIGQKLYVQGHPKILIHYGLWTEFLVSKYQYIQTALNLYFCHGEKHVICRIQNEQRSRLVYRQPKKIGCMRVFDQKLLKLNFMQFLNKLNWKRTIRCIRFLFVQIKY